MSDIGRLVEYDGKTFECVPMAPSSACNACVFGNDLSQHYEPGRCGTNPCDGGCYVLVQQPLITTARVADGQITSERRRPDSKPTNPKDRIGSSKLPVSLVPDTVSILASQAYAEGASKYGAYNWRVAGVRFSIYMEAMRRHQMKLWNGEWADKKTKVPHLASIIACAGIIEDARLCGNLTDDRPPAVDMEPYIEEAEQVILGVMEMNADKHPHHHTIMDAA